MGTSFVATDVLHQVLLRQDPMSRMKSAQGVRPEVLNRQKCILRMIERSGRPVSRLELTKWAFLLANERVRGVDYSEIEVKKFYRTHIPEGWHQNILDPNLDPDDSNQNRHESLDWTVTDFADFIRQVCKLWNIDLGIEEGLL